MKLYSDFSINIISFFISIIIFFLSEFLISYFSEPTIKFQANFDDYVIEQGEILEGQTEAESDLFGENLSNWYLEIPVIDLQANIAEGTTKEIMELWIGHFEETSKFVGNVGLAAHNRGYTNNYFENLKNLKAGDEIRYYYQGQKKIYVVEKQKIIEDTDWSILEETEENRITLITCVENEPAYRRCIQAIEK